MWTYRVIDVVHEPFAKGKLGPNGRDRYNYAIMKPDGSHHTCTRTREEARKYCNDFNRSLKNWGKKK